MSHCFIEDKNETKENEMTCNCKLTSIDLHSSSSRTICSCPFWEAMCNAVAPPYAYTKKTWLTNTHTHYSDWCGMCLLELFWCKTKLGMTCKNTDAVVGLKELELFAFVDVAASLRKAPTSCSRPSDDRQVFIFWSLPSPPPPPPTESVDNYFVHISLRIPCEHALQASRNHLTHIHIWKHFRKSWNGFFLCEHTHTHAL